MFLINSVQEAATFEAFLERYTRSVTETSIVPDKLLSNLYTHCAAEGDLRLFYVVLDLEIIRVFLLSDARTPGGLWNQTLSVDYTDKTILNDFATFRARMAILDSFNSMALRLRACWDKYMGILVLLHETDKYEVYLKASSRKRKFKNLAAGWSVTISPDILRAITTVTRNWIVYATRELRDNPSVPDAAKTAADEILEYLSNNNLEYPEPGLTQMLTHIGAVDHIRTAEAHGSGILRKWSLASLPPGTSRDFSLYNHSNDFSHYMGGLHKALSALVTTQ